MSLSRYQKQGNHSTKILFGNDTDVSWTTIVRIGQNAWVLTHVFDDYEDGRTSSTVHDLNYDGLKKNFDLQHGSPMHYWDQDDFDWITNDKP